jgi:hypothetical protein
VAIVMVEGERYKGLLYTNVLGISAVEKDAFVIDCLSVSHASGKVL